MPETTNTTVNNIDPRTAEQAAALIKQTAETTATALDIKYIQRDILEIKQNRERDMTEIKGMIKELSGGFASKTEVTDLTKVATDHESRIRGLETNVLKWVGAIGVGSIVLSVVIAYVLKLV